MQKFLLLVVMLFFAGMNMASCSSKKASASRTDQWMQPNGKIKVLSTVAMIEDLVQEIGGDRIDTLTLIKGDLDPHSYQLVKGDDEKLAFADLIFANGLGLEHGASLHYFLKNSVKVTSLGDILWRNKPALILHYNGQLDPHIWMDISLWAETVPAIVEALSHNDPKHAHEYAKRGKALLDEMQAAHERVLQEIEVIPVEKRFLVTSHDAFNYFTRAYFATDEERLNGDWQKRFVAPEGLAPESQLSATNIQDIINHMHKYDIRVLFPESNVSRDSIKKILQAGKEKGMDLMIATPPLYADAMGAPGTDGDTYLKMVQHNAKAISHYLKDSVSKQNKAMQ